MIKVQIGNNACKILEFLDENQISSVFEIGKVLSLERKDVLMALGWLAREDRIYFLSDKNDSKIMFLENIYGY